MDKFWMVWAPSGLPEAAKYTSKADAKGEAARLSLLHPAIAYYVLESMGFYVTSMLTWTSHELPK